MEDLLKKSKINQQKLRMYILRIVAENLTHLSSPCAYPKFKKDFYEILSLTGLTAKDIDLFIDRFYPIKKKEATGSWKVVLDSQTTLNVFVIYYFLKIKDQVGISSSITFFIIRQYSNLFHRFFRYCKPDVFKQALESLSKTHLFIRERGIPSALYFLSKEIQQKYSKDLVEFSSDWKPFEKLIVESRNRLAQSIKSFMESYYNIAEVGGGIKTIQEPTDGEEDNSQPQAPPEKFSKLTDDIAKKITTYRYIDDLAISRSKEITKISDNICNIISSELCNIAYIDLLRTILKLFLKEVSDVSDICGKEFFELVRKLMSIKRTTAPIYFKQQVQILLDKIERKTELYKKVEKFTPQTKYMISLYLGLYITLVLRHILCGKK